jgi:hypothetical protein
MIYIKDKNDHDKYKTFKEIAVEYNLPVKLLQGRYVKHKKGQISFEDLTKPKHTNAK